MGPLYAIDIRRMEAYHTEEKARSELDYYISICSAHGKFYWQVFSLYCSRMSLQNYLLTWLRSTAHATVLSYP